VSAARDTDFVVDCVAFAYRAMKSRVGLDGFGTEPPRSMA
jgi:hypothetical protein